MSIRTASFFAPLVAMLVLAACATDTAASDRRDGSAAAIDKVLTSLLRDYDISGMAVAVSVDGRRRYFTYGVASQETKAPVTADTLFEIGSVSKTFTSTLAAYAQQLGRISLHDHPGKYIPQLSGSLLDQATLLNLGTYTTGGLPLQFPATVTDETTMWKYFRQFQPVDRPGQLRQYSNPSIGLLGHITAHTMDADFDTLAESVLFPKLGLHHTFIHVPETEAKNYAWGYNQAGQPVHVNPAMLSAEAYGIKTSAADLITFIETNLNPQHLEPALREAVTGTHTGYFRLGEMIQGLGWEQHPYPTTADQLVAANSESVIYKPNPVTPVPTNSSAHDGRLFGKTGSTDGFGAYVAFIPEANAGVAILANKNFPIPARVTVAHQVLQELLAQRRR